MVKYGKSNFFNGLTCQFCYEKTSNIMEVTTKDSNGVIFRMCEKCFENFKKEIKGEEKNGK